MFEVPRPLGALAEHASVKENLVEIALTTASATEAACLTSSALAAFCDVKRYVWDGSRVLILGGSGGMGTFLVQLAKLSCASSSRPASSGFFIGPCFARPRAASTATRVRSLPFYIVTRESIRESFLVFVVVSKRNLSPSTFLTEMTTMVSAC